MCKKVIYILLLCSVIIGTVGCTDDNKGFLEEYHPMGNNPVQVVPWLKKLKKTLYKREARISLYELDGKEYYVVQSIIPTDDLEISPYTIYETNDEKAIVYFHSDNVLESEQDEEYIYFIENANLSLILWTNEEKGSPSFK